MYDRGNQGAISKFWIIFLICCYVAVFCDWGVDVFGHPLPDGVNTFLMMGYAKAAITFVKYLPQVYLNWRRQSVDGFSIENVALDFTGGSLSFLQSALKAIALDQPFFDAGAFNLVKFILSICSIFFDSIFFIQFCLYSKNKKPADEAANEDGKKVEGQGGMLDNSSEQHGIAKSNTYSDDD